MSFGMIYTRDPRRIRRLLRKAQKEHKTFKPPVPVTPFSNWVMGGALNANHETHPDGVFLIMPRDWRRIERQALSEARRMRLPRYPSQVGQGGFDI